MKVLRTLNMLTWFAAIVPFEGRGENVDVDVNVSVQAGLGSGCVPCISQPAEVAPTFQSEFQLRTGDDGILVSPLFREPRTEDNLRMEILYSGCFPVTLSDLAPPVERRDFVLCVRMANNSSGTGWGANPAVPDRMLGLYPILTIPHSTLFNYIVRTTPFPRVYQIQVRDTQVVATLKHVQAVYLNPMLPPTTAEFLVNVDVRIYPPGSRVDVSR